VNDRRPPFEPAGKYEASATS